MTGSGGVLLVVDMQEVFGDPASEWSTPGFAEIVPGIRRLVDGFGDRVVFSRFVAPDVPSGAWVGYYECWPFALVPADDPIYDLVPGLWGPEHSVITRPTFGKWDQELADVIGARDLIVAGVSTDCCVLSTVLAAADAGVAVRVVEDACAGLSDADHRRALDAMALYAPLVSLTTVDAELNRGRP